jgi:hypothetical protein
MVTLLSPHGAVIILRSIILTFTPSLTNTPCPWLSECKNPIVDRVGRSGVAALSSRRI